MGYNFSLDALLMFKNCKERVPLLLHSGKRLGTSCEEKWGHRTPRQRAAPSALLLLARSCNSCYNSIYHRQDCISYFVVIPIIYTAQVPQCCKECGEPFDNQPANGLRPSLRLRQAARNVANLLITSLPTDCVLAYGSGRLQGTWRTF